MENCYLCPRSCGADRSAGEVGYCGQSDQMRIARAALHYYEEPCISGHNGSGAVFFAGCSLGCVYCQNYRLTDGTLQSSEGSKNVSPERLCEIMLSLQEQGANNINLVTATHFTPQVCDALRMAKDQGLNIPVVYNTGSYENTDTLRMLEGLVDVYLPDLKYKSVMTAMRYSLAPDYFDCASEAIEEMYRQVQEPVFAKEEDKKKKEALQNSPYLDMEQIDLMKKGVLIRHLVLPGQVEDSKEIVRYLHETYGNRIYLSLMHQYTPLAENPKMAAYPELMRKVSDEEYEDVVNYAVALGVENGYIQEKGADEATFIPEFDGTGV